MNRKTILIVSLLLILFPLITLLSTGRTLAQDAKQNPTPIIISLTPPGSEATPPTEPTATTESGLAPDRFEPNDSLEAATSIGLQTETGLTLIGDDVDAFSGLLKAGQILQVSTTVYGQLDTRIILYWEGQQVAENDDRGPTDVGSSLTFVAPADGLYVALVTKATPFDGVYDLETILLAPTATPTPLPTMTPSPTPTMMPSPTPLFQPDAAEPNDTPANAHAITPGARGSYTVGAGDVDTFTFIAKAGSHYVCETVSNQVDTLLVVHAGETVLGSNDDRGPGRVDSLFSWKATAEQAVVVQVTARGGSYGAYDFVCQTVAPPAPPAGPSSLPMTAATATVTATTNVTATDHVSFTVRHLGRSATQPDTPLTAIRLLVYYDANNDRAPGPNEGITNVSVLAVDALGQRLAQVFTNAQGEAIFNLHGQASTSVARIIVPFVPAWSARIRVGQANDDIVLGLPAVRLPVFFPVSGAGVSDE